MSALAAACVSDLPRKAGYTAVPPERLYAPQYLRPSPKTAEITIRKIGGGLLESSCFGRLFVEIQPIAELRGWEQIVLYLARGQYSISYVPDGLCQGKRAALEIQVQANETRTFQIHNGSSGDFAIVEVGR